MYLPYVLYNMKRNIEVFNMSISHCEPEQFNFSFLSPSSSFLLPGLRLVIHSNEKKLRKKILHNVQCYAHKTEKLTSTYVLRIHIHIYLTHSLSQLPKHK